ncbi:hypothetical protein [Nocardia sp. NPDC127526]|uniref:hypothetical protein n=1 Tax=Nocardia sp. NPDC127526 TaxID=3345393 RepID=UPI003628EAE6
MDSGTHILVVLGIAFACGLVSMVIADSRNRSDIEFFIVGFILGPIGILIAILISPGPPDGMRKVTCPRCNAKQNINIIADAYECWRCKTKVTA